MDIGQRLCELREAKRLSQGDIEERTGLMRCYVSRVEHGHTVPSLRNLEKWAKALDLELYQLFFVREGKPTRPEVLKGTVLFRRERKLVDLFRQMDERDKQLLLGLAREVVKRQGKRE
jgi:transcriptional regulator with XRE-family HTH domain